MAQTNAYPESDLLRRLRAQLAQHTSARPGSYNSKWSEELDAVVSAILSREDFSYDLGADPMFRQYQDRYLNLGRQAMEDTMGISAALTGGYGNSHALLAGQQAYQNQLQGLYDRIPELYTLALQRWQLAGDTLADRYGLLSNLEAGDYSRHQDALSQWQLERDYLTGRFDAERDFGYGAHRDTVSDRQWQSEFDEKLRQFDFENHLGEFAIQTVPGTGSSGGKGATQEEETNVSKPEKKRTKVNSGLRRKQ